LKKKCGYIVNLFTTFIDFTHDTRKIAAQEDSLDAFSRLQLHGV